MEKKVMYIIAGVIVVLLIVIIGFFVRPMMMFNKTSYQQNPDGTQTYSNSEGTVTVGASMPSTWPSDVPANYTGAQIIFSGDSNPQTGKAGAVVSYTVHNTSIQAISDYYKSGLTAQGWHIEGTTNIGSQVIIGATKDTRTFGASIVDAGNGDITVTAGLQLQ